MFRLLIYLNLIIFVPCNCQEESVRKLLRNEGIIPKIVAYAPKQVCPVIFQNNYEIVPGQEYTQSVILREPKVTWKAENNTFYTLYMFGISDTQFGYLQFVNVYDKQPGVPRTQWNHWLVINIPGASIHRGRVIYKWLEIEPPNTIKVKVWYMFIIFKQPDLLVFNDDMPERHYKVMKNETNPFSPITDFMDWFQLKYEHMVACNFFIHRDERPTSSTINPTDLDLLWAIKCGKFAWENTTVRTTTLKAQYINVVRPNEIAVNIPSDPAHKLIPEIKDRKIKANNQVIILLVRSFIPDKVKSPNFQQMESLRYFCFGILVFNILHICLSKQNVTRDCKYFLEGRGLVPRILRVAPNQTCTIIYHDTTVIESGKTYDEFECGGTIKIKWNRRNNSTYHTIYLFGVSFIYAHAWDKRWKNWEPPDEWLYWVVTNIQDDNIDNGTKKGTVLFKYRDPLDTTNWEDHFYMIALVYEQKSKINVEYQDIHPKGKFKHRTYYPKARPFAFKYQLGDPIAGNAFEFKEAPPPPEAEEFFLINNKQISENLPRLISKLSSLGYTPFLSFHNKSYSVSWLPERDYKRDYERDSEQ